MEQKSSDEAVSDSQLFICNRKFCGFSTFLYLFSLNKPPNKKKQNKLINPQLIPLETTVFY